MKNRINNLKWHEKLAIVLIGVAVISGPLTEQFIGVAIDKFYFLLRDYGPITNLVSNGLLLAYVVVRYKLNNRLKYPPKTENRQTKNKVLSNVPVID